MPGYISLFKLTKEGMADVKASPSHLEGSRAAAEEMGIRVVGAWATMGQHDFVLVYDAPDDQTMSAFLLWTGSYGNVTTQTMRAFSEEELAQVISKMPE